MLMFKHNPVSGLELMLSAKNDKCGIIPNEKTLKQKPNDIDIVNTLKKKSITCLSCSKVKHEHDNEHIKK